MKSKFIDNAVQLKNCECYRHVLQLHSPFKDAKRTTYYVSYLEMIAGRRATGKQYLEGDVLSIGTWKYFP